MSSAEHNLVRIGQVLKTNGTEGETVMGFRDIDLNDIDPEEPVFIYLDGVPVPFFIENLTRRGSSKAIVKLSDISSATAAEEICGHYIYASTESLGETAEDEDDLSFLIGWTLYNLTEPASAGDRNAADASRVEKVGTVTDFLDIPGNPCIVADCAEGTVTIPLNEDLIESLDPDSRSIVMAIPDGLLSLR